MNAGSFFFRYRSYTPYPIVLFFAFFSNPTFASFVYGIIIIFPGEVLRLWGVAHIGRESRSRELSADQLITSGPYAYCRNPLYVANLILYAGVTVISNYLLWVILPLVLVYFLLQYKFIILGEEGYLKQRFGDVYGDYVSVVPRLYFRKTAWQPQSQAQPDWYGAIISEKSTFLSLAAMLLVFWARAGYVS